MPSSLHTPMQLLRVMLRQQQGWRPSTPPLLPISPDPPAMPQEMPITRTASLAETAAPRQLVSACCCRSVGQCCSIFMLLRLQVEMKLPEMWIAEKGVRIPLLKHTRHLPPECVLLLRCASFSRARTLVCATLSRTLTRLYMHACIVTPTKEVTVVSCALHHHCTHAL